MNVTAKTATYEIKDRSADTVLASGTASFRDSGTDKITGIELYSYTQTMIDIDNIKITAGYEIEGNVLYCVGTDETYDTYAYFDGEPVCISSQTDIKSLKEDSHTHSNKTALDLIEGEGNYIKVNRISVAEGIGFGELNSRSLDETKVASLLAHDHTHDNRTVLDRIGQEDINNWNGKADISHTHSQYAAIESPDFSGKPTAPTPDDTERSSQIATTLYVHRILEKSYSGNLDNIFAKSTDEPVVDLLCIGADNTPNGYNGTLSCVMTYHDQSGYNRHRYSQSYVAGPDFDEYTRSYEYGSGWTGWELVE